MMETELGVVVSSRDWAERLHRFTTDHGGARVRARVMRPEDALAEEYDVLFVDDITSFLNQRLVQQVQSSGRKVIGVFDEATGPEGYRRLSDLGVDEIIDASASPDEFLRLISTLDIQRGGLAADSRSGGGTARRYHSGGCGQRRGGSHRSRFGLGGCRGRLRDSPAGPRRRRQRGAFHRPAPGPGRPPQPPHLCGRTPAPFRPSGRDSAFAPPHPGGRDRGALQPERLDRGARRRCRRSGS